jgi:hypothetical protein
MKKAFVLIFLLIFAAAAVLGCSRDAKSPDFQFDQKGNYAGFLNLPTNYTFEDAQKDEIFATLDSGAAVNQNVWDSFIENASQGKNAAIRMARFYTDDPGSPYYLDLFYRDGNYYLFDSSADDMKKQPYSYLLTLKGRFGNPKRDSGVIVLANDNTLNFDTVMKSMVSSSMEYIKSVPEFEVIMFV